MNAAMQGSGGDSDPALLGAVVLRPAPRWLARLWGSRTNAMTIRNVIFASQSALERIAEGEALVLLTHEAVHVAQWRAHGTIGFLRRYVGDYLRGRAIGLPHYAAYRAVRFEREAVERSERR